MGQGPVRWGILGTASITRRRFLPALAKSEKSRAVAIGSRELARAQEFAREFDIPRPYGSYQEVLDDPEIECIYIPLPNHMHAEWTMRAADAGKHVLCEKPMAVDAVEATEMVAHCARRRVILMEGFMYRLNPRTKMIREVIDSGLIGDVRAVVAQFAFNIGSRANSRLIPGKGAGSLMDVGCYCINFCRFAMDAEPEWVMAHQRLDDEVGCDMTTSALLGFSGGRTALVNCSFETAFRSSIDVAGAAGVLRAERFFTPPETGRIGFVVETHDGQVRTFETDAVNQFLVETDHFADCVRGRTSVFLDPAADAVGNARAIEAVRESAGTLCRVEIGPA